jgi:AAA domain/Bifunctional DNA primase/polymerase, N-terminal
MSTPEGQPDYASAFPVYRTAGWTGTMPLKPSTKFPPPVGYTGTTGLYPSGADCVEWATASHLVNAEGKLYPNPYLGTTQLALRMEADRCAFDVDHYGEKRGLDTMREAVKRWGPMSLDEGPRPYSSSREGGSGIYPVRIPVGVVLRDRISFPELDLGSVEILQRHHRYAVVWPSLHPDSGARYVWRHTAAPDRPPCPDELPWLSPVWIEALREELVEVAAVGSQIVREFLESFEPGQPCKAVTNRLNTLYGHAAGTNRHDDVRDDVLALLRLGEQGHRGVSVALELARDRFMFAVGPDRQGGASEAGREFDRFMTGQRGVALVLKDPTPLQDRGCCGPTEPVELPPIGEAVAEQESEDENKPTALELEIRARERALYVDREARRRLALLDRARRASIISGLIDDLDSIEQPQMLLGSLVPELAVGFLAGRSGSYKSFLAVSWACCIATGRPWLGDDRFRVARPLKTLYVAAEGAAGAAARIKAWEAATGTSRLGRLQLYPRPIHLNDAGQAEELAEVVRDEGYEFLVVDTFRRSAPGAEENSPTEMGIVFDAVARIRDEHKCGVMFVDHTGHVNAGRPRGASSKGDDADYVLSADYDGSTREGAVQRYLSVTKLKDEESGDRWPIRLAPVENHFPIVELGTVAITSLASLTPRWFDLDAVPVPAEIVNLNGKGREAARDIFRVLRYVNDPHGLTTAQIRKALNESSIDYSDSVYFAGLSMLKIEGVIEAGSSTSKHVLAERFD